MYIKSITRHVMLEQLLWASRCRSRFVIATVIKDLFDLTIIPCLNWYNASIMTFSDLALADSSGLKAARWLFWPETDRSDQVPSSKLIFFRFAACRMSHVAHACSQPAPAVISSTISDWRTYVRAIIRGWMLMRYSCWPYNATPGGRCQTYSHVGRCVS